MILRSCLSSVLSLFWISVPVVAQDEGLQALKARCISFQVDGDVPELFAHSLPLGDQPGDGIPVEVRTYLNHEYLSLPIKSQGVVFTSDRDPASVEDKQKLVARLRIPDKMRSAILMFLPGDGKEGSLKYRVMAIEDAVSAFPRGSLKVMNLSPAPLRLMLEKEKYDVRSGDSRVIEDMPVGERNAAAMKAFTYAEDKWQRIGAGIWPHPGEKRVLQIAFYNLKSRKLEVRGIRDIAVRD
jgi:hypothetical protein